MAVCVVYAEQCCHAAVMAYEQLYERHPDLLEEWRFHGQPKVVLKTEDEESLLVSTSHTHTRLTALCPGLPGWAGTRKVKPISILLKQETVSGSGISWAYASLHLAPDR